MKVSVPDKFTGDVMGDLNKRRGRVLGMNPDPAHKGNTIVEADVPMLSIYGYSTDLRSMTGGSGLFSYELPAMNRRLLIFRKEKLKPAQRQKRNRKQQKTEVIL